MTSPTIDSAIIAFRNHLRQERTVEEIASLLTEAIATRFRPSSVQLRFDHGRDDPGISPEDPLVGYALRHSEPLALAETDLASPLLDEFREAHVDLIVPLVSQGTVAGFAVLGPPVDAERYSADDRQVLEELAAIGAAALRIAWLTHQHEASERAWESNAEELRIAQAIQRSLLPAELPRLDGWEIGSHYQPARVVGGDLFDFIPLPGDLIGIVFGDASDKSVPAALMMATARTLLRASAQRLVLPAQVLERVNNALAAQLPPGTFVTCFFAILDPDSGRLRFANAGQCAPFRRGIEGVSELRASGWPLGMMPDMTYQEAEITIAPGETVLFYSDGLIETHAPDGEMFGGPNVQEVLGNLPAKTPVIAGVRAVHRAFAGPEWNQEDDLTLVTLTRLPEPATILADFSLPSISGNELEAMKRVATALETAGVPLSERRLERLQTAVAETVMNATEHGNKNRPELPIAIEVRRDGEEIRVRVTDQGPGMPEVNAERPSLEQKLTGLEKPHGWGIFLTQQMVNEVIRTSTPGGYVVELVVRLNEATDDAVATDGPAQP